MSIEQKLYVATLKKVLNYVEAFHHAKNAANKSIARSACIKALSEHNEARRLLGKNPITYKDIHYEINSKVWYLRFF